MADLTPLTPCDGLLPLRFGDVALSEVSAGPITAILPYRGQETAMSKALKAAHGLAFPEANSVTSTQDARCIWAGLDQALLIGVAPDAALGAHAALVDQSDAWAIVQISGPGSDQVLARLVPIDLRPIAFGTGQTARTLVGHMSASITRVGEQVLEIMVFRSMAKTLVHELEVAAQQVAARPLG